MLTSSRAPGGAEPFNERGALFDAAVFGVAVFGVAVSDVLGAAVDFGAVERRDGAALFDTGIRRELGARCDAGIRWDAGMRLDAGPELPAAFILTLGVRDLGVVRRAFGATGIGPPGGSGAASPAPAPAASRA